MNIGNANIIVSKLYVYIFCHYDKNTYQTILWDLINYCTLNFVWQPMNKHYLVVHGLSYLAGVQHLSNGPSAKVSCGNDVFLTTRVPSSHCLCCCHCDSFSHADELFWCGGLCWRISTVEDLCDKTRLNVSEFSLCINLLTSWQVQDTCSQKLFYVTPRPLVKTLFLLP